MGTFGLSGKTRNGYTVKNAGGLKVAKLEPRNAKATPQLRC